MSDKKEEGLEIPDELKELFLEVRANEACRDKCINSLFKAKRAIYFSKKAITAQTQAWRTIKELYPQVAGGIWKYSYETDLVTKHE